MRVVFDTNVIVAGLVARGLCHEIVALHLPQHQPIVSNRLWRELTDTLRRKFGLEAEDLPVLALYRKHATWVDPPPLPEPVCKDPDDDWVLATAIAGEAESIVSGDSDLLTLRSFQGIQIQNPRDWLSRRSARA